jgi:hypothetical protein
MPVPFHTVPCHHLRPYQPNSERALLEQRTRLVLVDEGVQRRRDAAGNKRRPEKEEDINRASLKVAGLIGLLLVVLCALALPASAKALWPVPGLGSPATVRADSRGNLGKREAVHPSGTFDWADASVGAAFGAVLVPLLAGGVLLLNRGWVRAQLPAGSRPR